jgi:hypothetical protein
MDKFKKIVPDWMSKALLLAHAAKMSPIFRQQIEQARQEIIEDEQHCSHCNGVGLILFCIDDLCHGLGRCIHGDGEDICPKCDGEGIVYFDFEEQN